MTKRANNFIMGGLLTGYILFALFLILMNRELNHSNAFLKERIDFGMQECEPRVFKRFIHGIKK